MYSIHTDTHLCMYVCTYCMCMNTDPPPVPTLHVHTPSHPHTHTPSMFTHPPTLTHTPSPSTHPPCSHTLPPSPVLSTWRPTADWCVDKMTVPLLSSQPLRPPLYSCFNLGNSPEVSYNYHSRKLSWVKNYHKFRSVLAASAKVVHITRWSTQFSHNLTKFKKKVFTHESVRLYGDYIQMI